MSLTTSPFPPIADYAFLSNCHTGALVAPDGSVDWLCVPAFDSPSAFGNLLDRGAGSFRFGPYGINVPTARTYVPGTNVLATTWHTPGGWILVHDALTMGPRQGPDTVTPHTRPPADDDAEHLLVRTVECLDGSVEIELVCEPAFDYGREPAAWTLVDDAGHAADAAGAGQTLRLSTDLSIGIEGSSARARHVLAKGERAFCALSWADGLASPTDVADAAARIDATVRFWRNWLARARIPDHPLRHPLERSALTIKGLTYMPTGATVAALTTSLPETPGGERNWDYRYTWMRDSTFTLQALHYLSWTGRPTSSCSSSPMSSRPRTAACRSCTGSTAGATSPSRPETSCPATRAPARYGSGTARSTSARTTSSARYSTPSCCTPAAADTCPAACGRSCSPRPRAPSRPGVSRTRGSGRPAGSPSTTCRRS